METRTMTAAGALAGVLLLAGCGGGAKGADSPGTCPDGTVLKGSSCVPSDSSGDDSSASSSSPSTDSNGSSSSSSSSTASGDGSSAGTTGATTGATPYDKDAVYMELDRAVRQVNKNCGTATDDSGQATGPWGQTTVHVVLGRNGRVKGVSVPSPYDGKPVGKCAVLAFQKIVFPPYNGSTDAEVDLDINLAQPKK